MPLVLISGYLLPLHSSKGTTLEYSVAQRTLVISINIFIVVFSTKDCIAVTVGVGKVLPSFPGLTVVSGSLQHKHSRTGSIPILMKT